MNFNNKFTHLTSPPQPQNGNSRPEGGGGSWKHVVGNNRLSNGDEQNLCASHWKSGTENKEESQLCTQSVFEEPKEEGRRIFDLGAVT